MSGEGRTSFRHTDGKKSDGRGGKRFHNNKRPYSRGKSPHSPRYEDSKPAAPAIGGAGVARDEKGETVDAFVRAFHAAVAKTEPAAKPSAAPLTAATHTTSVADSALPAINRAFLSDVRFSDASLGLSRDTLRSVGEVFKFDVMSKVQHATLPAIIKRNDIFAKAKTGSGKTLAFLIPIVEMLRERRGGGSAPTISSLVIAPTRELALQIEAEAKQLITFHTHLKVVSVIGGRNINAERTALGLSRTGRVDILIATPGRLLDHMESSPHLAEGLAGIRYLVLDEADRLLDMGFRPALERILEALPAEGRQNLLFSATVPHEVKAMAKLVLKPSYQFIDCVGADEPETNEHVPQEALVVKHEAVMPALVRILEHMARSDPDHKVMVFFPTARFTAFAAAMFAAIASAGGPRLRILEIHSRKSQSARTGAAEMFKRSKGIFIFSSDVSARGMDFPDVTRVVQVGLTDREQYIHRLGRTARAGKSGAGLLLLADFEEPFLSELKGIPLKTSGADSELTGGAKAGLTFVGKYGDAAPTPALAHVIRKLPDTALMTEASRAYGAWMGFYNTNLKRVRWSKPQMVAEANRLFASFGLPEPPMMPRDTLGKMGLRGVAGIREGPKGWKPGRDD